MFGFFNINKPIGPTSHDIVAGVRRLVGRGVKVGHAGTLDPFADGILVVAVGHATRLVQYVQGQTKRYLAEVTLGAISTTDDPTGQITPKKPANGLDADDIRTALKQYVGTIQQVPPSHSAVHVDGKRAYHLARRGKDVNISARSVRIDSIELTSWQCPIAQLDITCGSGTYIRAIARDLGADLTTGGYCSGLTRTAVGRFDLAGAARLEHLSASEDLIDPLLALGDMPRLAVDASQVPLLAMGKAIELDPASLRNGPAGNELPSGATLAVIDEAGKLLALAELDPQGMVCPRKVFISGQG